MKQIDNSKTNEQNTKLSNDLAVERDEWKKKVTELVFKMKDNRNLSEIQVYQLSYRQQAQEKLAVYRTLLEQRQVMLDTQFRDRFREYSIGYDLKLNGTEKTTFTNADCGAMRIQIAMIRAQIQYFEECVKTLDNLGFAVRNRIEIISQQLI